MGNANGTHFHPNRFDFLQPVAEAVSKIKDGAAGAAVIQ
jgi:hypothetical protein